MHARKFSFLVYNDRGHGFLCDLDSNASFDNLAILQGNIVTIRKISYKKTYFFLFYCQYIALQLTRFFFLPSVVKSYAFIWFCESLMISCLIKYNLNFHIPMYYKNEWFQKDQYKQNETSIIIHVECLWPLQPYTNEKTTHTRYAYMYKQIHDVDDEWP